MTELPQPTEEHPDPRGEMLDVPLQVSKWDAPGKIKRRRPADVPEGAPDWWEGDEAATEDFMRGVGIRLGPDGEVLPR